MAWGSLSAAVALVCASCSAGHAASRPSATGSTSLPAPTSTTQPPPRYAASPYSWERSASPALALGGGPGATIAAVIAPTLNQKWLAVGTRPSPTGAPVATQWTSTDGVRWNSSPIVTEGASSALAAAQYHGETIVVGSVGEGANRQASAWISPTPGAPFTAASIPRTGGPSGMSLVTAGALGLFATGTVDGRFAVWSSTDGRHWSEQPAAEKAITSTPGARVWAMLAEGDTVYAAGSEGSGAAQAAAVWSTTDGLHWHSITTASNAFSGPGSRVIYSLAPLGNGLVAAGAVNRGSGWVPASWVSPDGASWSPPSTDFPGAPAAGDPGATLYGPSGGSALRSVSEVPTLAGSSDLVATGGGPFGQAAWRSTDGLHWTPLALPGADGSAGGWRATLIAATITTTVVADSDPGEAHLITDTPAGWSEPSANPATFGPVRPTAVPLSIQPSAGRLVMAVRLVSDPQAIGTPTVTYTTLASTNGVDWAPVPAGTAGPPSVPAAGALTVQLPTGWVAVGQPASGQPEGWTSPDGRNWTARGLLDGSPTNSTTAGTTASLPATLNGVCAAAPTGAAGASSATAGTAGTTSTTGHAQAVVAVGSVEQPPAGTSATAVIGQQAAAWVSTDGTGWKRATISPAPGAGGFESISGCARTASGLVAWGSTTTSGGISVPALWRSGTGSSWTRVNVSSFTAGTPAPLTDLAAAGPVELAVAEPNPAGGPDPVEPGPVPVAGPAASAVTAAVVGPEPTLDNGQVGLWLSPDGGTTWNAVDTAAPPWLGTSGSAVSLVSFAGQTPVLAGTVDGKLAVWTGVPVPAPAGGGRSAGPG